jgi:predicted AlkP superfamily phosphohydrolase/phosphomutase/desulfoferrodoxin (superoxide reductase-like protein)
MIGMDGMDPVLLQQYMDEGKLPNFRKLSELGGFRPLATSMPPQSPVAWANVISGCDPGTHEIYDFIHRDPNPIDESMAIEPYLSTSSIEAASVYRELSVGDWHFPLTSDTLVLRREGPTFWDFLNEHGIDATIYRMPANYPVSEAHGHGHLQSLTGMGTPDLLGSYGEFTLFSAIAPAEGRLGSGGSIQQLRVIKNRAEVELIGPPNFLKKPQEDGSVPDMTAKIEIVRDPDHDLVKIAVGDVVHVMQTGEWSDWTPVVFETGVPGSTVLAALQAPTSINGMVRFYVKEVRPVLEIFVTPINIDPLAPAVLISEPAEFATELATATGRYFTAGIPEHTAEIQEGALNEDQWLDKANMILEERIVQYHNALSEFTSGCLFFYIGTPDQISHIFWRDQDPEHPGRLEKQGDKYSKVIEQTYIKMDALVGAAIDAVTDKDTLIVMSDHGFASFRRGFNLNTWLHQNGYITRHESSDTEEGEEEVAIGRPFADVDWTKSQAYGIGLNGLYLNLHGREKNGIVTDDEKADLLSKLTDELLAVRDTDGSQVIEKVYNTATDYLDADPTIAPDLLIGYARNYRAGWPTLLGEFSEDIVEDNNDRWSGDHCIAAHLVPGILLSNKRITVEDPDLRDLAPTLLNVFSLAPPAELKGRVVLGE